MKILNSCVAIVFACGLAAPTFADPPEGRGWKKNRGHDRYQAKEEYWDGNCKVERKWMRNGDYKEERTCKGNHYHHASAPHVEVVLPPWINKDSGEPEYTPERRPASRPAAIRCNSSQVGSVLGGLVGGLLGHQIGGGRGKTAATIGGAIAGVFVGGEIGKRMDARNQACVAQALEFAPAGQRITWENAEGGEQYAVTPGEVEKRGDQYCRPYIAEVQSGGQPQTTNSTACRLPDGTWGNQL